MKLNNRIRYSELATLKTFEERFNYVKLNAGIGSETFGFDRYLNQEFYKSREWKRVRDYVIARDNGCDLGVPGYEIHGPIYIHHLNPITIDDVINSDDNLLDPNNLICVSFATHNAIHFGDDSIIDRNKIVERHKNDTSPWKIGGD